MTSPTISSPYALIADVVSYGYAFVVIAVMLMSDAYLTVPESVAVITFYFLLRWAAKEIRRTERIAQRASANN